MTGELEKTFWNIGVACLGYEFVYSPIAVALGAIPASITGYAVLAISLAVVIRIGRLALNI